jgi:2'-5' RNA ligase
MGGKDMRADNDFEYTDAPPDVAESLARAKVLPTFDITPDGIRAFGESRKKKAITIHLRNQTIESFKLLAEEHNSKYQTIISDLLDAYTEKHLAHRQ